MSPSAVDVPPPVPANRRRHQAAAAPPDTTITRTPAADRQLHAQDSDRVYQAAGDQYFLDHRLPPAAAGANTLPRDIAAFTGRGEEIEHLTAMMDQLVAAEQPIPVFTIDGMPGVGKTTFAVHVAHRLSPHFPDGRMFVDMYAYTAGKVPVDPADALFTLLSVDGVPAAGIPDDVDGRSALWRARMAGRRSILIIDNVFGYQQVEPLLPGSAGCLVLVTSRRRLTALGARYAAAALPLDPLPRSAAAVLFARLTGRAIGDGQEEAVTELVRLCGGLPLAIALLAARLRPEPQWRVQTLVDSLTAARDRLGHMQAEDIQVAAAFHLSYRCLPTARRRFLRRLGLGPGTDLDAYAAAALAGVGLPTARRHLEALYDDHLVEQPVQGRFRLHDLVGLFTRAIVAGADPQRDLAVGRLLDYYQHVATIADRHLARRPRQTPDPPARPSVAVPVLSDAKQAAAWMGVELENLLACATHAMNHGDEVRLIGLSTALATFLRHARPNSRSLALQQAAADAAGRRGNWAARAVALYDIGVLLGRAGDYSAATDALTEARCLHRDLGDRVGEADVLTMAGIVSRSDGDHPTAIEMLDKALARFRELDDATGQAQVLTELAVARWLTDDYFAATQLLDQALALHRQAGDPHGQANVLIHLGIVLRLRHEYPAAIQALRQASTLCRSVGARVSLANAQFVLGMVFRLAGDHVAATGSLNQALPVYTEVGDRIGRANVLKELGILRRSSGDHPGAAQALLESLAVYQDLGNQLNQAVALQELGVLWQLTGETTKATNDLAAALTMFEDLGNRTGQSEVLNYIGDLLLDTGDPQALDRFQIALRLAREVHNPLAEAHALEGIGRCSLHQHDTSAAIPQLRAALEIYQRIGAPEAANVEAILAALDADK